MLTTDHYKFPVSVIIATLGGDSLRATIEHLNKGVLVPSEILVCIPKEDAFRVEHLSYPNLRIVKTDCRGQVAQRAIGFQMALHAMILQLDDDTLLSNDALKALADELKRLGRGNALAPLYFNDITGRCLHEIVGGLSGFLRSVWAYLICGAPWGLKRMGVVTVVGLNYGVDSNYCGLDPFETQWLPGGCVLCFCEDVIRENFFSYAGKAYCEDLIHSFLRTQNGIRHWVIPDAKVITTVAAPPKSRALIKAENNARRHFVKISGRVEWRLDVYIFISEIKRQIVLKLRRWNIFN